MAIIKPFKGLRPPQEIVEELACLPYDVMNSEEAAKMAEGKEKSLLRITKAEIECSIFLVFFASIQLSKIGADIAIIIGINSLMNRY